MHNYLHKNILNAIEIAFKNNAFKYIKNNTLSIDLEKQLSELINRENLHLLKFKCNIDRRENTDKYIFNIKFCNLFTLMLSVFGDDKFPNAFFPNNGDIINKEKINYKTFDFWFDENNEAHVFNKEFETSIITINKFQL